MSYDTVIRVNAYFADTIATPNGIFTVYEELNERQPDGNGRGPMIRLFVEEATDTILNDAVEFVEEGTITAQIFVDVGESTADQHKIATTIRDAFRQVELVAGTGEQGNIYFQDISQSSGGQVEKTILRTKRKPKQRWWTRWDVFITYQKYCS